MITWALTTISRDDVATVTGCANDTTAARDCTVHATRAAIARARSNTRPRYLLHVDGKPVALIDTGLNHDGQPDHAAAADLLDHMSQPASCSPSTM
ncbi:MAG: hypothetical protein ACRDTK_00485 [Mycobacterium sp.]